jgi:hypothetical protein
VVLQSRITRGLHRVRHFRRPGAEQLARQAWIYGTQANWHCLRGIGGGSVLVVVIGTVA